MQDEAIAIFETIFKILFMNELREKLSELTEAINQKERELRNLRKSVESLWDELEEVIQKAHDEEQNVAETASSASIDANENVAEESSIEPEENQPEPTSTEQIESEETTDSEEVEEEPLQEEAEVTNESPEENQDTEVEPQPEASTKDAEDEKIQKRMDEDRKSLMADQKPSVLDNAPNQMTLGDRAGLKPIADLKKAMAINERFLFANELFGGDMKAFNQAIEELNHISSHEDAKKMMNEQLATKYSWDEESEITESFRILIARRFA